MQKSQASADTLWIRWTVDLGRFLKIIVSKDVWYFLLTVYHKRKTNEYVYVSASWLYILHYMPICKLMDCVSFSLFKPTAHIDVMWQMSLGKPMRWTSHHGVRHHDLCRVAEEKGFVNQIIFEMEPNLASNKAMLRLIYAGRGAYLDSGGIWNHSKEKNMRQ